MTVRQPDPISLSVIDPVPRSDASRLSQDIRIIRLCAVALVLISALTMGALAGGLLAPTAIAAILALVLSPLASGLERLGLTSGAAAVVVVTMTIVAIAGGAYVFAPSASDWAKRAPDIVRSVEHKLRPIKKQLAVVESASRQITAAAPLPSHGASIVAEPADDGMLSLVAMSASHALATLVYTAALTIFLLSQRRRYTEGLILLPRRHIHRLRVARVCRDVRNRVAGYLLTLAMINVGLAAATALCFALAGIADPFLWGIAFGILNFIPIIGPATIILSALAVGFATANTLTGALVPAAILLALDTVEAYFVQPLLLSRRLVLSPVAIFVTVATLVWMWGAPAAIIAVPLLILLHTVLSHVPQLRPYALFLASEHQSRARRAGGTALSGLRFLHVK